MSRNARYQQLIETSWRRQLTPAEESELRDLTGADAQARAQRESETALTEALSRLGDAPVSSNFTARVLQAVQIETARYPRERQPILSRWVPWRRFLQRAAFASVILAAGLLSYHKVNEERRARFAESVAAISSVASLPSPEILKDFDAIQALPPTPPADEELLSLMQ